MRLYALVAIPMLFVALTLNAQENENTSQPQVLQPVEGSSSVAGDLPKSVEGSTEALMYGCGFPPFWGGGGWGGCGMGIGCFPYPPRPFPPYPCGPYPMPYAYGAGGGFYDYNYASFGGGGFGMGMGMGMGGFAGGIGGFN